jgi:hypothetical protein
LLKPDGVDFASSQESDGVSIRIIRDYVINTDDLATRLDVLYGWKELYPQWACKVFSA